MADRYLVRPDIEIPAQAPVPEGLKKKLDRNKKLLAEKEAAVAAKAKEKRAQRFALKMRTNAYEKEYKAAETKLIELRRQARREGSFFMEPDAKLMFVIRITGINKLAPKPKKILQLLRLRQLHNGVFVKVSRPMQQMLVNVNPYVTFGYPTLRSVKDLIYKRGCGKVNKQRIPLKDNQIISDNLGRYGIHGMEDLIHEIYTVGPHFKQANNFLWPFKLNSPKGGFVAKRHGFVEPRGGDWGNREELINKLIKRMN
mmetsp:Transcript_56883/g.124791  ORF Transcript_56883/g.124791 Transcript_56883/m.124791 type:complete len:256 (-) Transcript_56883:77-844(-)